MPPPGYIAYIDEAGDDGLKVIKTDDARGATEWMVISAVVIKAGRESEVLGWTREIVKKLQQHQLTQLHYLKLSPEKKLLVCSELANLPVRLFSMISHKKNMEGRRNLRAEKAKINKTAWFYCWMSRLLLERVTAYCGRRTHKDYGECRPIQFEFSDRGGVIIEDIRNYYAYLKAQSAAGTIFTPSFDLDWTVVDTNLMYNYPNNMRAGLQLSDVVASSFFGGLERTSEGKTNPEPAKLLLPRMCRAKTGKIYGFGVKLMPVWVHNLPADQANLLNFYMHK